jgi:ribosomal protein S18 acetylase RimI-like enzyme
VIHVGTTTVVRRLGPNDVEAVAGFFERLATDHGTLEFFHPHSFDRATAARVTSRTSRDVYLGAFSDAQMVGYAILRGWDAGYDVPTFGVAVDPSSRGRHIGTQLLQTALDVADKRGARAVMLHVEPENTQAVAWYQRVGFKETGAAPDGQLELRLILSTKD